MLPSFGEVTNNQYIALLDDLMLHTSISDIFGKYLGIDIGPVTEAGEGVVKIIVTRGGGARGYAHIGVIEELIAQYPQLGDCVIGAQSAISIKDMPDMKPMIKYWIKDYKDKVAIYNHTNLDRVQYICHDKNTRNMNDEERRQLNLIVKSVDGEIELPYSTRMKKIDFSLIEEE